MTTKDFPHYKDRIEFYGLYHPNTLNYLRMLHLVPDDQAIMKELDEVLMDSELVKSKNLSGSPFYSPFPEMPGPNDIKLGIDEHNRPYYFNIFEFFKHCLIAGVNGVGKSWTKFLIAQELFRISQATKAKIRWTASDPKDDFANIANNFSEPIACLRPKLDTSIKINLLQIMPGLTAIEQINLFVTILSETGFLQEGGHDYLTEQYFELLKNNPHPTVIDLLKHIEAHKVKVFREVNSQYSAKRALKSLIRNFGSMLDEPYGLDIPTFVESNNVALFLDKTGRYLAFWAKVFIVYHISWRMANNMRNAPLHIYFVDEGNLLFSKAIQKDSVAGISLIEQLYQQCREYNIGFITSSNNPSTIVDTVKSNSTTKIMYRLGETKDMRDMNDSMGHNKEQALYSLNLTTGEAIVKKEGQKSHLIKMDAPPYPPQKISQEALGKLIEELEKTSEPILKQYMTTPLSTPKIVINKPAINMLSDGHKILLMSVCNDPVLTKTQHFKKLGISVDKGSREAKFLFKDDYLMEKQFNLGGKVKNVNILFLKEKSYQILGIKCPYKFTNGESWEHWYILQRYAYQLRTENIKNYIGYKEKGKEVDLAIRLNNHFICTELSISTTPEHEIRQLTKNSSLSFTHHIILATNKNKVDKLRVLFDQTNIPNKQRISILLRGPNIIDLLKGEKLWETTTSLFA